MKMKGLLLKDWYLAREYCRAFAFIVVIFLVVSFWASSNVFYISYPVVIMSMIPVTLIASDEKEKWNIYSGVLPYTKKQLVISKYLIGFLAVAVTVVLVEMVQAGRMMYTASFDMEVLLLSFVMLGTVGLLVPMIVLPLIFKFGAEKGRILYMGVIMIFCFGCIALMKEENVARFLAHMNSGASLVMIFAAVLVLYVASCLFSIALYKRREM